MTLPILATKLYSPPLREDRISRPRLLKLLQAGISRKLTLVSAPAGFGKTTLISDWLNQQDTPFIWYQLDETDSDPIRFVTHLLAGIRQHLPNFGMGIEGFFQGQAMPPTQSVFTELINAFSLSHQSLIVVLDDYHRIESDYLDEGIEFLLEHQPSGLHLVMMTREDPNLSLARLRGRGMMTEIRASHLRFTSNEIEAFLKQTMHLSLDKPLIKQLDVRTEGWIAGLQLASLSLVGREDISTVINNFRGDDRYVVDYLMTEVLHQQDQATQDFLLKTSVLETLSAPICNHLTARDDSNLMLEKIDTANLFLVPLDNRRQTYRYHHLFADLLRHQLKIQYGDDTAHQLHIQASNWYHEQDDALSAIHHATQIEDHDRLADLLAYYRLMFLETGEWFIMGRLMRLLPAEIVASRLDLAMARAWEILSSTQMSKLAEYLEDIVPRLNDPQLIVESEILLGYVMLWRNQPDKAIEHSQRTLENLGEANDFLQSFALNNLGFAYRAANQLTEALEVFQEVDHRFNEKQDIVHLRMTIVAIANIHEMRGDLIQAKQAYHNALERYTSRGYSQRMMGLLYLGLGNIYYEWNDLDLAEQHLKQSFAGWSPTELAKEVMNGHIHLTFVYQAQGKPQEASQEMQSALDMARGFSDEAFHTYLNAYQARLDLMQGQWTAVGAWASSLSLDIENPQINDFTEYAYLTLVRWWLKDNTVDTLKQIPSILQPMLELADETGRDALKAEALLLNAMLAQTSGDSSLAVETLIQSLQVGHQFRRLYINEGDAIQSLLKTMVTRDTLPTALIQHAENLLTAIPSAKTANPSSLIEPLTEREQDVLKKLASGQSNRQIAEALFVSVGTVKTHARHIYEKLSVNNRTHAVVRARELGILE
jgi:LuxR family transcriptional regulator, maltose regulon positive regulatory protein